MTLEEARRIHAEAHVRGYEVMIDARIEDLPSGWLNLLRAFLPGGNPDLSGCRAAQEARLADPEPEIGG